MENITFETKLYTAIWEFNSPFSYEETIAKIEEWKGILTLTRYAISNRAIRDDKWNQTLVDANTQITVKLDTNKTPILCYEEYKMTDVNKTKNKKSKS